MLSREVVLVAELPKWHAVDVFYPEQSRIVAMVNGERAFAFAAKITVTAALLAIFDCLVTEAMGTMVPPFFLA